MRILVITACTGQKAVTTEKALTIDDFSRGAEHLKEKEKDLAAFLRPAEAMYTGQQHIRLMRGIRSLREQNQYNASPIKLDLWIVSAGYGIIPSDRIVAPYECTFQGMKSKDLRRWADRLKVPEQFREVVRDQYNFGLILLGGDYLSACSLDPTVTFGGPTLLFCGSNVAENLPSLPNLRSMILSNPEAQTFHCGHIGLKGEVASRLLAQLAHGTLHVAEVIDPNFDLMEKLKS